MLELEEVSDPELGKKIRKMILELIGPEEAGTVGFIFVTNVIFLGYSVFHEELKKYFILINIKVKEMLCEEKDIEIVHVMIAHEIGHFRKDKEAGESSCIEADKEALIILSRIYKNPKEVLLNQIDFAEKNVLEHNQTTKKEKEMTAYLAKQRRNALKN